MLPQSTTRVEKNTPDSLNQQIRERTIENITSYASASTRAISRRIDDLDAEWDIERLLEANASSLALVGIALGAFVSKKWLILPAAVAGFLLQHALQGWCPPVPALRRLGVRTPHEIEQERYALKVLRGDFDGASGDVKKVIEAVNK